MSITDSDYHSRLRLSPDSTALQISGIIKGGYWNVQAEIIGAALSACIVSRHVSIKHRLLQLPQEMWSHRARHMWSCRLRCSIPRLC